MIRYSLNASRVRRMEPSRHIALYHARKQSTVFSVFLINGNSDKRIIGKRLTMIEGMSVDPFLGSEVLSRLFFRPFFSLLISAPREAVFVLVAETIFHHLSKKFLLFLDGSIETHTLLQSGEVPQMFRQRMIESVGRLQITPFEGNKLHTLLSGKLLRFRDGGSWLKLLSCSLFLLMLGLRLLPLSFLLFLLSSFAEFERCMIRDRIKDKAAARAAQGLWVGGRPPFGYQLGEQRMLVTEPAEAEVVRLIYEMVLQRTDLCEIANRLNRENAPRPWLRKGVEDNAWSSTRVRQLIERPLYSGVIVLHGNEYPSQHEALISPKDWKAAQQALAEVLAERKPEKSHPELVYPLRGIWVCPLCRLPMKPTYAKTRGQIHRYYECPNHESRHKGYPTRNQPAESIEMAVAANLASLASNPAMMRVLRERLPQLAHRDISEALSNVEQLVEYIPDDALATLFQALYKEVSYNAAAQELNIVKYFA